jgi:DNA mismatch endonuclease (patch repair protein)
LPIAFNYMADTHSKQVRSYNMARIRSKNTAPEMLVRKFLFAAGLRYRLHDRKLPGSPDIILPKYHTAIFIHGCFWHSHVACAKAVQPKSNSDYWSPKLQRNRSRDQQNQAALEELGWHTIVLWECELTAKKREDTLKKLLDMITS